MASTPFLRLAQRTPRVLSAPRPVMFQRCSRAPNVAASPFRVRSSLRSSHIAFLHSSPVYSAQSPTADALMENLTDLYATAKDEFEIAAEETEKKTVYAADDREAAREALTTLKDAFQQATSESDPETSKEVQRRVGDRIRELESAVVAMEERAMED